MKRIRHSLVVSILLFVPTLVLAVFGFRAAGQSRVPGNPNPGSNPSNPEHLNIDRPLDRATGHLGPISEGTDPARRYFESDLSAAQKALLAPPAEDLGRFADFLKQPNTGLIRLLPKGKYEYDGTVAANGSNRDKVIPLPGGGSVYSFTERTHVLRASSDISLEDGQLRSAFAGRALGLLVELGDQPVDSVSSANAAVGYLEGLHPPHHLSEASARQERDAKGFKAGGYAYRSLLPAKANVTYALRSTTDDRADILVVFRVISLEEESGAVLLWKRLERFPTVHFKP